MKISVCMATYNGQKYIKEQLDSILIQLKNDDEVIISDDSSSDKTTEIVKAYNDKRIKVYEKQKFRSPIFNFENALQYASGDIIVLSDQDDVWENDKLDVVRESFKHLSDEIVLMMFNGRCIDENGSVLNNNLFEYIRIHQGLISNIMKNSFIGCNIAFTKNLLNVVLPFPDDTPMHDMWLGTSAYIYGDVKFVDRKVFNYRLHENNFTGKKTSLIQKIKWRVVLIKNLIKRYLYVKYFS
jgi:glycosyltransferase involved in cell wall biosynthesis